MDKDDVADCFDKCLDSLHNKRVDSKGCPLDTDRDVFLIIKTNN
jgi:hypothetical protein